MVVSLVNDKENRRILSLMWKNNNNNGKGISHIENDK